MTSYILPDDLPNDSFAIDLVSCHNFSLTLMLKLQWWYWVVFKNKQQQQQNQYNSQILHFTIEQLLTTVKQYKAPLESMGPLQENQL